MTRIKEPPKGAAKEGYVAAVKKHAPEIAARYCAHGYLMCPDCARTTSATNRKDDAG